MDYALMPLRRYAEFSGRSRRKEYWMFTLLNLIVVLICYGLMLAGGGVELVNASIAANTDPAQANLAEFAFGPLFWLGFGLMCLFVLASLIPSIAVTVRRLHDRNLTGWLYLGVIVASFIPLVNIIAAIGMLVLMLLPGNVGDNKYGPDPKDPNQVEAFA